MARCWPGDRPLSGPVMESLLMLFCLLSLQVVAPVRESCAQTLGVTLHHMCSAGVTMVAMVLLQLLQQPQWEVRHGGLLGLKYLLAVREVSSESMMYSYKLFDATYRQTSNIRLILIGNKIVDHSDVVGASPVGAAPTTSSFSTEHLASMDWAKTTARWDEKHLNIGIWCNLY